MIEACYYYKDCSKCEDKMPLSFGMVDIVYKPTRIYSSLINSLARVNNGCEFKCM